MALGQVSLRDWFKVLKHEMIMGLLLGLSLGGIAFLRTAFTPEDVRGNVTKREHAFTIKAPPGKEVKVEDDADGKEQRLFFSKGCVDQSIVGSDLQVILPRGEKVNIAENPGGEKAYHFPAESQIRSDAISRWRLALVIAQAVAVICLWGTLVGSMLPLIFRRLGVDPGIASSPFVATFVDVTGIIIYFTIAKVWLLS
ncbi:MAG: magnesium transporter [Planctomycetes bacterium]|nr:magnesium transporter [Planctomycetota bacterium]